MRVTVYHAKKCALSAFESWISGYCIVSELLNNIGCQLYKNRPKIACGIPAKSYSQCWKKVWLSLGTRIDVILKTSYLSYWLPHALNKYFLGKYKLLPFLLDWFTGNKVICLLLTRNLWRKVTQHITAIKSCPFRGQNATCITEISHRSLVLLWRHAAIM